MRICGNTMASTFRPAPPGASATGLFECLRALADEARSIGLGEAARAIRLAADFVATEAEENGLALDGQPRRSRPIRLG